ncbi:radical SAM protein [Cytobacillus spongiae]|uniref:radical SAM protein n=1 Tax=Cytobacillus spongiae TaxID=2901381 RepID=UPI003D7B5C63
MEIELNRFKNKYHSTHYHLIIMPTEQCNFRCVYCYEDFIKGQMTKEHQDALTKHIEEKASSIENLEIGWFGGEPLEGYDVIKYISERVIELSKKYGFKYSSHTSLEKIRKTLATQGLPVMEHRGLEPLTSTLPA